jgi:exodeoxyribonuclease III
MDNLRDIKTKKKENINQNIKIRESKKESKSKSKSKSRSNSRNRSRSRSKSLEKKNDEKKSIQESLVNKKYPEFPVDENKVIKIIHWNVNGIYNLLKTKELDELIKQENPDIICFNETKIDKEFIQKVNLSNLFNKQYKSYWYCSEEKKGYAGTAILTKYEPKSVSYGMNINKHDKEGRIITMEYDKFYLICCYTPNSGEGLKRLGYRINEWDKDFFEYINSLKTKKDIILTGDLNVAKGNLDIFDPKGREKLAGFTQVEKESFVKFLKMGYTDTFRNLHPKEQKYSFFSMRGGGRNNKDENKGWRLDYFIINKNPKNIIVKESDMLNKNTYNSSDHIPIFFSFTCK